jgi:hypothetical protein
MALTTRGGDASGFQQQGTTDWVALAQKPVEFSFNVLARYSKAGIDPLTVAAGQAACTSLKIPWKTQQEVLERMSKLPCVAMYGQVAWFGFGLKHALHDLTDRDGGLQCLTLCGCLAESYNSFFGAQVLHAFCQRQSMPSDLLPGIRNWHALLKPCAGIFAGSKFSNLVQGFARLLVPPTSLGIPSYEATAPDALAQALILLTQVSSKQLENFTVTGGIDCAWPAATAEFIFGFRIEILTSDGAKEYCTSSSRVSPGGKIQVTFLKDGVPKTDIEITQKCFTLPGGQELIKIETNPAFQAFQLDIRSPWATILGDSFGKSTQDLLHHSVISHCFGQILVYASHDYTQRKVEDPRLAPIGRMPHSARSRYGNDLLDFAASRLPELKRVLRIARGHQNSRDTTGNFFETLEEACGCKDCENYYDIEYDDSGNEKDDGGGNDNDGPDKNDNDHDYDQRYWCLIRVARTIVKLIWILSMTNVHGLDPIPFGVRRLYDSLDRGHNSVHLDAHGLFSTSTTLQNTSMVDSSAIAVGGICSFPRLLTDPKLPPILAATANVIPGHIEYSGALFEKIEDLPVVLNILSEGLPRFELEPKRTFELLLSETPRFKYAASGLSVARP